ncbi:MAG: CAP domain-containing protein [Proteobacteria bacterium]|nr:CAP domain-containing protein [Pseudomonadota bacterium]
MSIIHLRPLGKTSLGSFGKCAIVVFLSFLSTPSLALDLNSFRAQHKLPALSYSATLAGAAYEHARSLAKRERLDHDGFKQRVGRLVSGMAAENVSFGCEDQDCAIRQWARSAGHRANMLLKGITSYGIASARGDNGRRYWVLELGN